MRECLRSSINLANMHAEGQKEMSKIWYDKKARHRSFNPDDEVLALLPLPGKPLHAKFYGPYHVFEKLGLVDYRMETPDQRKTERICHVNLLKPYRCRDETQFPKSAVSVGIVMSSPVKILAKQFLQLMSGNNQTS